MAVGVFLYDFVGSDADLADPLRTGLAVKPAGAPMYSAGKDGDLRDIWQRVIGQIPLERGATSSGTATIMTVYGKEGVSEHKVDGISKEIAIIGKHFQDHGAKRVAIYLPNSIEFLAALFAGAFYGFTPILIPYNQPHPVLVDLLVQTGADAIIAEAGSIPLADVIRGASGLRQIVWTVEKTSRHMDWNEVPEGIGGKIDVSVWHQLVQEQQDGTATLPPTTGKAPGVVFLWQEAVGKSAEIVEFTQQVRTVYGNCLNIMLIHAEPRRRRRIPHHCATRFPALQFFRHFPVRRCFHSLLQLVSDSRRIILACDSHH
jgi:acyl-CoA synthetase (AMP-forming)/AMP-acid ligase II